MGDEAFDLFSSFLILFAYQLGSKNKIRLKKLIPNARCVCCITCYKGKMKPYNWTPPCEGRGLTILNPCSLKPKPILPKNTWETFTQRMIGRSLIHRFRHLSTSIWLILVISVIACSIRVCLELGKTAKTGIWHCFDGGNPFFYWLGFLDVLLGTTFGNPRPP